MDLDPVGTVMAWISAYGPIGLFVVALTERFVPLVPSCGLLLAVGIAAAEGAWSLPVAFLATTTGGVFGCAACFYAVRRLGEARSLRLLNRAGHLFGISTDRIAHWIASFRINQMVLAFSLQLVPTVRLFVPAFCGRSSRKIAKLPVRLGGRYRDLEWPVHRYRIPGFALDRGGEHDAALAGGRRLPDCGGSRLALGRPTDSRPPPAG